MRLCSFTFVFLKKRNLYGYGIGKPVSGKIQWNLRKGVKDICVQIWLAWEHQMFHWQTKISSTPSSLKVDSLILVHKLHVQRPEPPLGVLRRNLSRSLVVILTNSGLRLMDKCETNVSEFENLRIVHCYLVFRCLEMLKLWIDLGLILVLSF